ncbi:hypothetical protein [Streptomyces laurentii]|uniref:hypothetical protein n=1 Tax=Streptomyces laurentii TaxID=39478 RepID=UPI0036C0D32D
MSETFGPIETMAEQFERRCSSTVTDPEGRKHQCVEQSPHPEITCHDDTLAWGE